VRPSFVPPRPIRQLRDLTRYRKAVIEERGREAQRLHKVLEDAGVKLASVASKTLTKSGRAMLEALIAGQHDPHALAELAKGRMRAKIPQLREALTGRLGAHHGLIVAEMLARVDHADATVQTLSARIDEVIAPFARQVELLCTIPGVARRTAEVIIAEIGVDMSRFPAAEHLASWAGMCPGNNESAGNAARVRPARAPSGCAKRWSRPLMPPVAARTPTCPPSPPASAVTAAPTRLPWPSAIPSWSLPTICLPATRSTPTSAVTSTSSCTPATSRPTPTGWSVNSNVLATA
jgi:transposase